MSFILSLPPQTRDVLAIYVVVGLLVLILQYLLKYVWFLIALVIAKVKGEDYRPPFH